MKPEIKAKLANVYIRQSEERGLELVIHKGIVVAETTTHVKVWNHRDKEACQRPEFAEWFALNAKNVRTDILNEEAVLDA